jgi:hypothetical protein
MIAVRPDPTPSMVPYQAPVDLSVHISPMTDSYHLDNQKIIRYRINDAVVSLANAIGPASSQLGATRRSRIVCQPHDAGNDTSTIPQPADGFDLFRRGTLDLDAIGARVSHVT